MRGNDALYVKKDLRVRVIGIIAGVMTAVVLAMCWCSAVM